MSFLERIKERKIVSPVVEFKLGDATFKAARFSQVEKNQAMSKGTAILKEEGYNADEVTELQRWSGFCVAISDVIKKYLKGWDIPDFEFNLENVEILFSELSTQEKALFGMQYLNACQADLEEKKKAIQSQPENSLHN